LALPNNKAETNSRIDGAGIVLVTGMVLSLLYGLKNIDFFNFGATIKTTQVYPFLLVFVLLLPLFILVEKKAQDPIISLKYFTNGRIVITLLVSFAAGFVLMGIVFIPQFSENVLKIASGKGGYFTVILGVLSGVSAMLSGRMIDRYGAKKVLLLGFAITIFGALFIFFVAAAYPGLITVIVSLMFLGFGLGFTIGAPINYMMLENIKDTEANSGLATVSLIRSIGTSIAPAIMVGFIAHAGSSMQADLMRVLPNEISVPELPYVQDITEKIDTFKSNPQMSEMLGKVEIPDLSSMQTVKLDFSENPAFEMPAELLEKLQSSDVTTITEVTKSFAEGMFAQMSPGIVTKIQNGVKSGIDGITSGLNALNQAIAGMQAGGAANNPAMQGALAGMQSAQSDMKTLLEEMNALNDAVPAAFTQAETDYLAEIDARSALIEETYQSTLNSGYQSIYLTVAVSAAAAGLLLIFYKKRRTDPLISE